MYDIKFDTRCTCGHIGNNEIVNLDNSFVTNNSDPEVLILIKQTNFDIMEKHLRDRIKSNREYTVIEDLITKEMFDNCKAKYIMYIDNITMPYALDTKMINGLNEADIVGPLVNIKGETIFRNDNIVTCFWMMEKDKLINLLPIPTKLEDFTLYRKIKDNDGVCGIVGNVTLNI